MIRILYNAVILILIPFLSLPLAIKMYRAGYLSRFKERFGFLQKHAPVDLWIHAASVGEVKACSTFIKNIQIQRPDIRMVLSTLSCTGYAEAKRQFGNSLPHFFFGFDLPWIWQKVLRQTQAKKLVLVERETWPNLLYQCNKNHVEADVINAKLSKRTAKKIRRGKALFFPALRTLSHCYAQSQDDCRALKQFGVRHCNPVGNLKFDITIPDAVYAQGKTLKQHIGTRPIWVAGSTHPQEEIFILKIHQLICKEIPNALCVIAPRHPERFDKAWQEIQSYSPSASRYSENKTIPVSCSVLLLDTLGDLLSFYAAADVCFVAGSVNSNVGGHNLLEPAALGKPIITGNHTDEIKQITRLLDQHHALFQCETPEQSADIIIPLLQNPEEAQSIGKRAQKAVAENRGATQACIDGILNS